MKSTSIFVRFSAFLLVIVFTIFGAISQTNSKKTNSKNLKGKPISSELFGLFFEDINYSADGGLYAELVQNRSFEYTPTEQKGWNPLSFWEYTQEGNSYGQISVETTNPIHLNNPHYIVLNIETFDTGGVGLLNKGFDGMVVKAGDTYNFSLFSKLISSDPVSLTIRIQDSKGKQIGEGSLLINKKEWTKYKAEITVSESSDNAALMVMATKEGTLALDMISLFPQKTFLNRSNGLRADLGQLLADMKPRFIRFPGGCLVHGEGLNNMYRWQNTIGPLEERVEQRNIWGYNQTAGLGYFEYFQFCEDIGAQPLPVVPAGVCCQNSGGAWRTGGNGQQALPMACMEDYVQDVLDLIEWANGPATSEWGSKRVAAGHAKPFNLKYVGVGNEDKITPDFQERFRLIFNAVKEKYPEITVIGTVGPFDAGEDFEKGWKLAKELSIPIVDEHYYKDPKWFINNQHRYDSYDRTASKVYLGEYATSGNKLNNAISEAAFMIGLERNGDVVAMSSYAPLFAKKDHIQWKTDMVFFDNTSICLTPNFYVQKMFSTNAGDRYFEGVVTYDTADKNLAASCVLDSKTGDVILKFVNFGSSPKSMKASLNGFSKLSKTASLVLLTGAPDAVNTLDNPDVVVPKSSILTIGRTIEYTTPPMSLTVIRIPKN